MTGARTGVLVADCHGTAGIDREAVAEAVDAAATVTTTSVADHRREILDRLPLADLERVVLVAGEGPATDALRTDIEREGVVTATVSPYLGAAAGERASAVVAGAVNAAVALGPARAGFAAGEYDEAESVVVVGDATVAADLATEAAVTLVADGEDHADAHLPPTVDVVAGRARDLEQTESGYALSIERRVDEECTACGRCLRRFPDATTATPVDVVTDDPVESVCPIDAIAPADDPVRETLPAQQVVWPGYDGPLADAKWVHTEAAGVVGRVRQFATMRNRPSVAVDASTCAVGTSGQAGCSACEEICPNDAIAIDTAGDGAVSVADARCVGCGSCVSACPTGSIEPVQTADLDALLPAVERAVAPMASAGERGGLLSLRSAPEPFVVAFVADSLAETYRTAVTSRAVPAVVPVFVPNVLSIPDVAPLAAVAHGADAVVLATDPRRPTGPVTDAREGANRVLADVGAPEAVATANTDDPDALAAALSEAAPASALPTADRPELPVASRHDAGLALASALVDAHGGGEAEVHVPGGGSVAVEAEGCTLCETCHGRCPTGALVQSTGTLSFDPAACVGCGVCEEACPEDVLDVSATATVDPAGVGEERVVVEKEMVECEVCGEPFASRAGLDTMREQLDEAALEAIDLEVCPACRKGTQYHAGIPR